MPSLISASFVGSTFPQEKDSAKPQFIMAEAPPVSSHGTEVDPVPSVLFAL
jgi:hypothetical protein